MTRRAIIIGLLASAAFAAMGFFNDMVMKQTFLFSSYMPAFVYGLMILFVLCVNPLLTRLGRGVPLSRPELATIIVLVLPACFVSGRTLIHHFPGVIITPKHYNKTRLGWQRYNLLGRVPPAMLARVDPKVGPDDILNPAAVRDALSHADDAPAATLLSQLAAATREDMTALPDESTPEAVARILDRQLAREGLFVMADLDRPEEVPAACRDGLEEGVPNALAQRCLNRALMDTALEASLRSWQDREDRMVHGFHAGLDEGTGHIAVATVPWRAWTRTLLLFWMPLLLALCLAYIGFALVTQRQWADHEHLPFPIVTFTEAVLPDPGKPHNHSLFRNRAFWICAGVIAVWHLNNYAVSWWPDKLIEVPRVFHLGPLASLVPFPWPSWRLVDPILYFSIIGIAYFISSEASLSVGIAPYVFALLVGFLGKYGIDMGGGNWNSTRPTNYLMLGGYVGLFLMLVYSGRHHFLCVARRCLGLKAADPVRRHEVWGGRLFVVSAAVYVLLLRAVGIGLLWGVWYFLLLWIVYTVVARIVAETGMILIHPVLFPSILAVGFVGERLVGLEQVVPMVMVSTVIGVGCHVVMLPLFTQGLRIAKGGEGRAAVWTTVSLVVALAVAVPVAIYLQYDYGATTTNDGWTRWLPYSGLDAAEKVAVKLDAQGFLDAESIPPDTPMVPPGALTRPAFICFAIAVLGVILCESLRLRLTWWPLHPILFVVLDFWVSRQLAASFLVGWLIKTLVTRYGGTRMYQQWKPVMLGLIAGDMLGQVAITVICTIYSLNTGVPPKAYWVLPG